MTVWTFQVTLDEPLLATMVDGDPNSAVSYPFVPGGVLRGALIARYLRQRNKQELDAADPLERGLFFDGTARYLNAYPLTRQNERGLPAPRSLLHAKGNKTPYYDFACEDFEPDPRTQWQPSPASFCTLSEDTVELLEPQRLLSVHTARDRDAGRSTRGSGAVYRYESLAAEQTFAAALLCDDESLATTLGELLTDGMDMKLGGSRTGSYGMARISNGQQRSHWTETTPLETNNGGSNLPLRLVVTLLSDALLRGEGGYGAADPARLETTLRSRLPGLKMQRTFAAGCVVGGFNRKWGLPLPQEHALQMGSVFVYDLEPTDEVVALDALRDLQWSGVGARRVEGFGRLTFNWHGATDQYHLDGIDDKESNPPMPISIEAGTTEGDAARALAERMATRLLRLQLDRAVAKRAGDLPASPWHQVNNSQLSRLRSVLQDALRQSPDDGRKRLNEYLSGLQSRQSTRGQFQSGEIADMNLLDWMRMRVDDASGIWGELGVNDSEVPKVGDVLAPRDAALSYEYNLRLLDAVLARAAKANREREAE